MPNPNYALMMQGGGIAHPHPDISDRHGIPVNIPTDCVEIDWPVLKEVEDDYPGKYTLEMRKTKVRRIYCKHQAKYNDYKVRPSHAEQGKGTEDSPYVAIGTAIEHAVCLIHQTCVYVQVYIMPDSEEVFIFNYGISTFDSADNRLLIGSTDGETYFKSSDISESPNGQHIADALVCQCRYTGDKAPCSNGNLSYFKCEFTGTKVLSESDNDYVYFSCRDLTECKIKNINVSASTVCVCDISYDVIKFTDIYEGGFYSDSLKGGDFTSRNFNKSKITNVIDCHSSYIHDSEISGIFEEVRYYYNMKQYTRKLIYGNVNYCTLIDNSTIRNCRVVCDILINSTIVSIGSKDTIRTLAYVSDVCNNSSVTFSTTMETPISGGGTHTCVALYADYDCMISSTTCTCSLTITGSDGYGGWLSCGIEHKGKCVQNCKTGVYNFTGDPVDIDPPSCDEI